MIADHINKTTIAIEIGIINKYDINATVIFPPIAKFSSESGLDPFNIIPALNKLAETNMIIIAIFIKNNDK
ncbi:Uncharacterised protein [Metamycoplasma alkalescens]|uniref:Uncharacterized protein n=1 Tax=Metamycoplasma alkalescens TaxID=45363 RepID=A0A3B0PE57_9BACT|nr:Uncharacterised protein [Metamycoplasma alkalescens]